MRQKTKNHQTQGSIDKKFDFFPQSLSHIPRWVYLVQKTRAKNSHAWAPLSWLTEENNGKGKKVNTAGWRCQKSLNKKSTNKFKIKQFMMKWNPHVHESSILGNEPVLTCTGEKRASVTQTQYTEKALDGLKKQLPLTYGFNKKGPLSHDNYSR